MDTAENSTRAPKSTSVEPAIVTTGFQLTALLRICGHVAYTLENVPDGPYRDKITTGLSNVLELAESMAQDLLIHAEQHPRKTETGGA